MLKFFKRKKNKFRSNTPSSVHTNKKNKKFRLQHLAYYSIYAVVILIFVIAAAFAWFSKDLPTPSRIAAKKPTESTKIYDRTGQILLYETGDQKRTIIKSDQISPYLKDATVSVEDANFYHHHGFDSQLSHRDCLWLNRSSH